MLGLEGNGEKVQKDGCLERAKKGDLPKLFTGMCIVDGQFNREQGLTVARETTDKGQKIKPLGSIQGAHPCSPGPHPPEYSRPPPSSLPPRYLATSPQNLSATHTSTCTSWNPTKRRSLSLSFHYVFFHPFSVKSIPISLFWNPISTEKVCWRNFETKCLLTRPM
jgi:hypothetical protein